MTTTAVQTPTAVNWVPFPIGKAQITGTGTEGSQFLEATFNFPENFNPDKPDAPENSVRLDA